MKFLIADDSYVARLLILSALENFINKDDIIIEAIDGISCVEMYKSQKPDICFIDLNMPNMSGIEVIEAIRNFDKNSYLIVLTADVQKFVKNRAFQSGAVEYFNKPLKKQDIEKILEKYRASL